MICIECDGRGSCWYGNRSTYATCEICGGMGILQDNGCKHPDAPSTPLWPQHDQSKLESDRNKRGRF